MTGFRRGLKSAWFALAVAVAIKGWQSGGTYSGVLFGVGVGQALMALRSYVWDGR